MKHEHIYKNVICGCKLTLDYMNACHGKYQCSCGENLRIYPVVIKDGEAYYPDVATTSLPHGVTPPLTWLSHDLGIGETHDRGGDTPQ